MANAEGILKNLPRGVLVLQLNEIRYALDAVNAAVKGADMNDTSQQRGISYWISELYFKLGDLIKEMEGDDAKDDDE